MLLSKQASKSDLLFPRGRHSNIKKYYISQSFFHYPRITIRNNSNIINLFNQIHTNIKLKFYEIAGLDMKYHERKQVRRKAWENDYDYLQLDKFDETGDGRHTIRNCNKTIYIECTPEMKPS